MGVEVVDVGGIPEPAVSAVALQASTGDRQVVGIDGAGADAHPPTDPSVWSGVDAVMVDGHHPALALWAARGGRERGLPVIADAGRWRPVFADLLPLCTDVICSDDFRMDGGAVAMHDLGVDVVATSHGGRPIEWSHQRQEGTVEVPPVEVVDTLGAGDALHGAYVFARLDPSADVATRLGRAAAVASLRCSRLGPRAWLDDIPDRWKDAS